MVVAGLGKSKPIAPEAKLAVLTSLLAFWALSFSRSAALWHHFKAPLEIYAARRT